MVLSVNLTNNEVEALESEKSSGESIEDVIHRLVTPLVGRVTQGKFNDLLVRFKAASPDKQSQVIAVLEKFNF